MIKTILVPATGTSADDISFPAALAIARQRAPDRLLSAALELGAGLLVMRGYGHGRLREWVFGGFARRILDAAPLPVLISH